MKREFLKELGLEEEQIESVMKEYGSSVNEYKDTISKFEEDLEDVKTELTQKVEDLTKFKEQANLSEEQASQLDELKQSYEQQLADRDGKIKEIKFNSVIDTAILKSNTVDEVALKAHLQPFLAEAEFSVEKGTVNGLEDKLQELQKEKSYLFKKGASGVEIKGETPKNELKDTVRKAMGL